MSNIVKPYPKPLVPKPPGLRMVSYTRPKKYRWIMGRFIMFKETNINLTGSFILKVRK